MTTQPELDRILDDYLGEGTDELADHVLAAAFLTIDRTRQRRALRVPWRNPTMPTSFRLLIAAALLATALGGAYLIAGLNRTDPNEPSPSPAPTGLTSDGVIVGATAGGTWVADRPAAFGAAAGRYALTLGGDPMARATGPGDSKIVLGRPAVDQAAGQATFGPIQDCRNDGTYRFDVSDEGGVMDVELIGDACVDRAAVLTGRWTRTAINDPLVLNQRYAAALDPGLTFVVPPGFTKRSGTPPVAVSNLSDGFDDLLIDAEDFFAIVSTGPIVQRDRCDREAGTRPTPASLDEFVAWNRATTGATVSEPVGTTVSGHDAIFMDVTPTDACANGEVPANCGCLSPTSLVIGMADRTWAVDVDGAIVLIQFHDDNPPWLGLTPERLAVAEAFIDSIEFD